MARQLQGLGYGKRRLIGEIIKKTWDVEDPYQIKLGLNEILYLIQEYEDDEGKKYLQQQNISSSTFRIFKDFAQHLLYRNLANYDSMVLLTSEKGCLTDDTLITIFEDGKIKNKSIKELLNKGPIKVLSYNIKEKKYEVKLSDGVEYAKTDEVYEVILKNNYKIKATKDHPFLLTNGDYKQLKDLLPGDELVLNNNCLSNIFITKKFYKKDNVYDVVNVKDNHNFIANGFVVSNTGKCIYIKDEKDFVVSADGNLIHPKDADEIVFLDNNMKLKTGKVKKHFNRPEKDVYELKLRSGKRIYLTKEHPLKTIHGWKPLKDLKQNDFIATPRKYLLKNNGNMNKGLIKLLAYIIADGHMSGKKLEFTKNNLQLRNDFKKSLYEFDKKLSLGESVRIINIDKSRNNNGQYKQNNSLMNYLKEIGLYEKRSKNKFIPKEILILKNKYIALFLNRLYSCDGGVEIGKQKNKNREINYTTKSELMARQIQHLLLRFNIQALLKSKQKCATNSINHKGYLYWQLTISGKENIINFKKNIGFFHKEKNKKLNQIYNDVINLKSNTNIDIIPKGVFKNYNFNISSKQYLKIFNVKSVRLNTLKNVNISRYKFKQIANAEQDETLLKIAYSDIFWDKILSIKKIDNNEVIVYDLEVDDQTHNFVANDIIIHNSSAAIVLAREWCKLIGIRFDPRRHLAYSNRDVMEKIDLLNKFEPLVADEAVRFASAADWNKTESKILKRRLAEVRTKHLLFILNFPLKISKIEKNYLDSFVNYWVDLFGRGLGAIYVKDKNPSNDPWRLKDFKNVGSYTEFTKLSDIEKKLMKHPNFWQIIKFPKPPAWLYTKYLEVREKNVYNEEAVRETVTSEDVHRALLVLALQDVMMNDTTINMNRIALHIKNTYDIPITKNHIQSIIMDSKQLVNKIREEQVGGGGK
jgi:intein/homing endonuclease